MRKAGVLSNLCVVVLLAIAATAEAQHLKKSGLNRIAGNVATRAIRVQMGRACRPMIPLRSGFYTLPASAPCSICTIKFKEEGRVIVILSWDNSECVARGNRSSEKSIKACFGKSLPYLASVRGRTERAHSPQCFSPNSGLPWGRSRIQEKNSE
jgi:hypothetical protein